MRISILLISILLLIGCTGNQPIETQNGSEFNLDEVGVRDPQGLKQGIWKKLDKSREVKSVSFYEDDINVADLNPEDFTFDKIKFGQDRYEILKPNGWSKLSNDSTLLVLIKNKVDSLGNFMPNMTIRQIDDKSQQLDEIFVEFVSGMKSKYEKFGTQTVLDLKIDERDSKYILFAVRVDNINLLGSMLIIDNDKNYITINTMGGLYKAKDVYLYKGQFEEMLSSFKFLH